MQSSLMVYHGISHESLVFSWCTHKPLGECVYQKNTCDLWDIPCMVYHELSVTILLHAIENTVANIIVVTHARLMMGRLDAIPSSIPWLSCILIGCIFYGMVQINIYASDTNG